jgi:hypothetical protein
MSGPTRRFAETLAPLIQPDDIIWIHDYHMIPLARDLRRYSASGTGSAFSCIHPGRCANCWSPCRTIADW